MSICLSFGHLMDLLSEWLEQYMRGGVKFLWFTINLIQLVGAIQNEK